jgi:hypothetical protein
MNVPFTTEQFLNVFADYNRAIWPMQIFAYALGAIVLVFVVSKTGYSRRIVMSVLAFFWVWMGVVYHIRFFSRINRAAYIFGGLFIAQAIIFSLFGTLRDTVRFSFRQDIYGLTGSLFVLYAMVAYPLLGNALGHGYPNAPLFGVAPCPTTIFTFGVLLWADRKVPLYFLVIPLIWSIIAFSAAISLGIREDIGLLVAGVGGTVLILFRNRRGYRVVPRSGQARF